MLKEMKREMKERKKLRLPSKLKEESATEAYEMGYVTYS